MSFRTSPWPDGTPCWADLSVPDVDAARDFYSAVLGWTFSGGEAEYGGYLIAETDGAAAAGIGPQQPGEDAPPVAWTLYLASADADGVAERVPDQGGTVLAPPFDVGPLGRMLVAQDPSGAAFGVWQAGEHLGAGVVNRPGAISWEDLRSHDPDAARAFYAALFGYAYEALPMAGPDYTTFSSAPGEPPLGGMGGMMLSAPGAPSHWLVYFGVDDTDAAVETARQHGGSVLSPPMSTPFGRMAGLADPAGAVFTVIASDWAGLPDRSG